MRKKLLIVTMLSLTLTSIAFGGFFSNLFKKKETVKIGHKNFTEQRILGQMLEVMVEEHSDLEADVKEFGGTMLVNEAFTNDKIDLSCEYTGTAYLFILKADGSLKDPDKIFEYVKDESAKQGITWLNRLGFNNTYAFAVKPATAKKYNLKKYSDLVGVAEELSVGEVGDFFQREDGMPGITKTYGFSFDEEVNMDTGLKYLAVEKGDIDVAVVYATDGMLEKYGLVVLEDDKNFFPPYDAVPRMKTEFAEAHPEIVKALKKMGGKFSDKDFQKYNYQVDVLGHPEKKVAEEALREKGLIK